MTRPTPPAGGVVIPAGEPTPTTDATIRARQSGFADVGRFAVGRYDNFNADGSNIQPQQDAVDMTSVPPGNSFNEEHYAEEIGEGDGATSELLGASITMLGEMREFETEITWERPDGSVAFDMVIGSGDPADAGGEYWETAFFYTWIGRGFEQDGQPEVTTPGDYTVRFFNPYIDERKTITTTGAVVDSCTVSAEVPQGGSAVVEATVDGQRGDMLNTSGKVVAIKKMTEQKTNRDVLGEANYEIGGPNAPSDDVTIEIPASDIGSVGESLDIETYTQR